MAVRLVVRTLSEICVTAGSVIVLFVVYVLYWTGVRADGAMDDRVAELERRWAAQEPAQAPAPDAPEANAAPDTGADEAPPGDADGDEPAAGAEPAPASTPPPAYEGGEAFAVMYIPRLGADWAKPVLHGTGTATLREGLGHYASSARLGERGNVAVAGHRRTYGDPFKDFPLLGPGDAVVLNDGRSWYTYRIDAEPYRTLPSDTGVLAAVPRPLDPTVTPYARPGRYLTLTTCDPEWGSSHRLIAWAHLDAVQPVAEGKPGALRGAGR